MKLLFMAGSARQGSLNKKLAKAAEALAQEAEYETTLVDLRDFPMPLYDGDLEAESGLPEKAIAFKELFTAHQGVFIASPEYNSSFSPLLKNTLDWISRPHYEKEPRLSAYQNKVFAISAASPGGLGGLRGLVPLRMLLGNVGTLVIPEQLALSNAASAFDENDKLTNESYRKTLQNIVSRLGSVTQQVHA